MPKCENDGSVLLAYYIGKCIMFLRCDKCQEEYEAIYFQGEYLSIKKKSQICRGKKREVF